MKRGSLRVAKDHTDNLWHIQGRKNGQWCNATDAERKEMGLPEDLAFELKYDACGYLVWFIDWVTGESVNDKIMNTKSIKPIKRDSDKTVPIEYKKNKKAKRKISVKSKRRNRK